MPTTTTTTPPGASLLELIEAIAAECRSRHTAPRAVVDEVLERRCLLFGIATLRAGILSRRAAGVFAFGGPASAVIVSLLPHEFARIAAVPIGVGLAWLGYSLWSDRRGHQKRERPRRRRERAAKQRRRSVIERESGQQLERWRRQRESGQQLERWRRGRRGSSASP